MKSCKVAKVFLLCILISSINLITIIPVKADFDTSQAAYYEEVKNTFSLTVEQEEMLEKYGFVITELLTSGEDEIGGFHSELRFEDFYFNQVYQNDLPVFVTTDSILHLFHVVFDCSLKLVEKEALYPMAFDVTQFAYQTALNNYQTITHDDSMQYWATRNATIYFAVAYSLITGENASVPTELSEDMSIFLDNIYAEDPQFLSAGGWSFPEPPFSVEVKYDFTQFTVRGHYLGDSTLERYFRTLMWYGRFPVFVPRSDEQYVWSEPHFDAPMMVYMRDILKSNSQTYNNWVDLYEVTGALVGESDSINLLNLETALHNVFGNKATYLDDVAAEGGLAALTEELGKPEYSQQILSQALVLQLIGVVLPRYPIVYNFMGQRYVPDSYMFQKLCWDQVGYDSSGGRRIMPKGLDVFAALGSERAYQLLAPDFDYEGFEENLENLTATFANMDESEWQKSSYTSWMYALESLTHPTYFDDYPEFMQNEAWHDEKLNTALASWAQLRHDTILYAKQTYIPAYFCSYPEAFVEPNPTFYSRMYALTQRTIEAVNLLSPSLVNPTITESFEALEEVTQKLEIISTKELAEEQLTEDEIQFIKTLVWNCGSGGFIGWYVDTIHAIAHAANSTSTLETPLIADVATFPPGDMDYPPQIKHVGVGHINVLIVLYPKSDGTLVTAVGPVFSYYEFELIGTKRLNDDEWKEILEFYNRTTYLPDWSQAVYARAEPVPFPEYPSGTMFTIFAVLSLTIFTLWKGIKNKKRYNHTKN